MATPRLRRYARALATGGAARSDLADDLVQATLVRALGSRPGASSKDLVVRLYATLTQLHREAGAAEAPRRPAGLGCGRPTLVEQLPRPPAPATAVASALMALPLEEREALVLVVVEGFDHDAAARILRVARPVLVGRLARARDELDSRLSPRKPKPASLRGARHLRLVAG